MICLECRVIDKKIINVSYAVNKDIGPVPNRGYFGETRLGGPGRSTFLLQLKLLAIYQ